MDSPLAGIGRGASGGRASWMMRCGATAWRSSPLFPPSTIPRLLRRKRKCGCSTMTMESMWAPDVCIPREVKLLPGNASKCPSNPWDTGMKLHCVVLTPDGTVSIEMAPAEFCQGAARSSAEAWAAEVFLSWQAFQISGLSPRLRVRGNVGRCYGQEEALSSWRVSSGWV